MSDDLVTIIALLRQIIELQHVHTQLFQHLIRLAEPAPNEGDGLAEILLRIERMLTIQGALLRRLVEQQTRPV